MNDSLANVVVAKVDGREVTHSELSKAFDAIRNKEDWKAPILAVIKEENFKLYAAAVEFFTATPLTIRKSSNVAEGSLCVESIGYRAGPAC
jgi:hypothetical protein